jgi:signal transduction histidine kinase
MKTRARKALWLQLLPLIAGFVVLAVIIGARSWLIEVQRQNQEAVLSAAQFERRLTEMLSELKDAETGQRGFLLTGAEPYLEPLMSAREALPRAMAEIRAYAATDREQAIRVASMEDLVAQKLAEIDSAVALYRDGRAADAIDLVRTNEGKRIMDALRSTADGLRDAGNAAVAARLQSVLSANRWLSVGSVAALFALAWLAVVSVVGTRRRMIEIVAAHDEVAAANEALSREMKEKAQAETQIRQMQKMEAVGQLTGGIAHDFNNMLAVVVSALNLIQRKLGRGETDVGKFVDAALDATNRAASLTQRLLAFSRQQPLAPQVLDINRLIAGMSEILSRTLGATIRIETVLAGGLWKANVDASQLENAVLNLAVNGRDAMADGGRLTIETANAHLDDTYAALHSGVPAGQYVMLAVTDTGMGMTAEVVARAFDPFFTTKPVDKGTGLGLSQVFGFVKQSGGHVKIYSEPGQGTAVKIYLPRHFGDERTDDRPTRPEISPARRDDVILVVEDDARVRALTVAALLELGYTVLQADGASAALQQIESRADIALLFTDIVMPDVNGRKLADQAVAMRPDLKVLFTTGFTRNAVVHNGVLDHGVNFIAKPFTIEQLEHKVDAVLGPR